MLRRLTVFSSQKLAPSATSNIFQIASLDLHLQKQRRSCIANRHTCLYGDFLPHYVRQCVVQYHWLCPYTNADHLLIPRYTHTACLHAIGPALLRYAAASGLVRLIIIFWLRDLSRRSSIHKWNEAGFYMVRLRLRAPPRHPAY